MKHNAIIITNIELVEVEFSSTTIYISLYNMYVTVVLKFYNLTISVVSN